jgi:hypothetical protein
MWELEAVKGRRRGMTPTEATVSLGYDDNVNIEYRGKGGEGGEGTAPDADELDINVDRESPLECVTLLPSCLVVARVHLVCEGDLLVVAGWQ